MTVVLAIQKLVLLDLANHKTGMTMELTIKKRVNLDLTIKKRMTMDSQVSRTWISWDFSIKDDETILRDFLKFRS